jgi:hypothetical protein
VTGISHTRRPHQLRLQLSPPNRRRQGKQRIAVPGGRLAVIVLGLRRRAVHPVAFVLHYCRISAHH